MRATLSIFITGIGVALLVVSATLVAVGYTAYSAAGSLLLDKAVSLGVEPGAAATLVPIMTILITPLLTGALISASFGRVLNRSVATVVIGLVVVGFSYYAFTKDWLFDSRAKSIAYLCPPQGSDGKPRVSWRSVDNIFGIPCTPITPEIAPAIVALRQGVEPTKLIFTSTAELDALQTHK